MTPNLSILIGIKLRALESVDNPNHDARKEMNKCDSDRNNRISKDEFHQCFGGKRSISTTKHLVQEFSNLDQNKDGFITMNEIDKDSYDF